MAASTTLAARQVLPSIVSRSALALAVSAASSIGSKVCAW